MIIPALTDYTRICIGPEYGTDEDLAEGDIKMTPEQAALFKQGGWEALVKSEAWIRNHGRWQRYIPYTIVNLG